MELSIIIPTLNEEKLLPFLLERIKSENLDLEIIVADAGSSDKTQRIAEDYGARVVSGGLPAEGRNSGAKFASGEILFFLDADVFFQRGSLKKILQEFKERKYVCASFGIYPQEKNFFINKITMNMFYNFPQRALRKIMPLGAMGIIVKKEIFEKVGGFDESVKLAEDHHFVKRASKLGRYGILKSSKIYMPLRRFRQDGYIKTFLKYAVCCLLLYTKGPIRKDIINYNFDHYNYVNIQSSRKKKR